MPLCLVVSAALRPNTKTSTLARVVAEQVASFGLDADLMDLASTPLPACDGVSCYSAPEVIAATARVKKAAGVIICSPIYNYQFNAAAKNFLEVTNGGWHGKIVGLVMNAASERSFMAALPFVNSLWIDHHCLIAPRFVYATNAAFVPPGILPPDGEIAIRIKNLAADMHRLITRLDSQVENPSAVSP